MKKYVKENKGGCPGYEIVTIDGNKAIIENLFLDTKAVWKQWESNILNVFGYKNVKDYVKRLKDMGFVELENYKDDLVWLNPNTGKAFKQYQF